MRNTLEITILAMLILSAGCAKYDRELLGDPQPEPAPLATTEAVAEPTPDDVEMFDDLSYYGQWYWIDPYGWTWRPTVVSQWQPFTQGHWVWTEYGWMWADYDPWGWATTHYGYWATDFTLGWIWIPGYTWSPVQCNWILYDDYICWSPVPPPGSRYKDPWDDDKAWVSVPIRKFKETNVADYRSTPKFKSNSPVIHRAAPNVDELARQGARFKEVDVELYPYKIGDREITRVKFPQDVYVGASGYRPLPIQTPPGGISINPPVHDIGNNGDAGTYQPPTQGQAKSKGKTPKNDDSDKSGKTETKYKSKKSNDKKDGDSKDDSKGESKSEKKKGKK